MELARHKILATCLKVLVIFGLFSCSSEKNIEYSPEHALNDFFASQGAEDQLMDPLILSGADVVPLVLAEIEKKDMLRRRYAIGALGNIQDKSALPVLEKILNDKSEEDYFRCDALNSIGMIDFQRGNEWAKRNQNSSVSCLSELSYEILKNDESVWLDKNYMRRTKQEALSGRHK